MSLTKQPPVKSDNIINYNDPKRNMYGCAPCPKCNSVYRFARNTDCVIVCDDCGHEEQGVMSGEVML